jgi:uncharacterized membrane-anchored protein
MKHFLLSITLFAFSFYAFAQDDAETLTETTILDDTEVESQELTDEEYEILVDSIHASFYYEYGSIALNEDLATLQVPSGYKFLNAEQSKYVLEDLWGNMPEETLGLLFPENIDPLSDNFTYAVEITYTEDGFIEDEDAEDIDYNELLETMQEESEAMNTERKELGYDGIELIGWAQPPYYDNTTKKLHWAKELHFENYETNTLNYNIRVLGRKGFLTMNVIGEMNVLPMVQNDLEPILSSVEFNEGNRYADFNPDIDTVAAYGIGGLIAGKILAKAGFFALILKFWKVIAIGAVGAFGIFKKKLFGGKSDSKEA